MRLAQGIGSACRGCSNYTTKAYCAHVSATKSARAFCLGGDAEPPTAHGHLIVVPEKAPTALQLARGDGHSHRQPGVPRLTREISAGNCPYIAARGGPAPAMR